MTSLDRQADWGYLCAAGLSLITFILLFQPWLSASGQNGKLSANAFGRIDGSLMQEFNTLDISGKWGLTLSANWALLAAAAAFVTIFAVVMHFLVRSAIASYLVIGSSAAVAVFVLGNLLYLNSQAIEFRILTTPTADPTTLIDKLLGTDGASTSGSGGSNMASAGLDLAATLGGVAALGAASIALVTGLRRHRESLIRTIQPLGTPQPNMSAAELFAVVEEQVHAQQVETEPSHPDSSEFLWEQLLLNSDLITYDTQVHRHTAAPDEEASDSHPRPRRTVLTG